MSLLHGIRAAGSAGSSAAEPLVGAAIGLGMTAEAAERGGADFLLALGAGRYRAMGAASLAAMLPLADSNRFTDEFARREILDRVAVPVFFGACAFDPGLDLGRFVERIASAGYHGVANFPTSIHYDGRFRAALEEAGLGFGREVDMLVAAGRAGLATIGYAKTRDEIRRMLDAGIEVICLNFGWNAGGVRGVEQGFTLEEAAHRARRMVQQVRQARPETVCVVEGGPIVNPADMYRVCRDAKADGYIGGSTLDRVPLELSVMQATSAFKAVGVLRDASAAQSKEVASASRLSGLVGRSGAVQRVLEAMVRLAAVDLPVRIVGEAGLGRTTIARSLHGLARRRGPIIIFNPAEAEVDQMSFLFGSAPSPGRARRPGALEAPQGMVIVLDAGRLTPEVQLRVADWLGWGDAEATAGSRPRARLVLIERPGDAASGHGLRQELAERLAAGRLDVPALRDRPEDIPDYARLFLAAVGRAKHLGELEVTPDGYRTLIAHGWPENTRELRRVVEQAALAAQGAAIGSGELAAAIGAPFKASLPDRPADEKDWILEGLRRNRFRRGETARFLGLSRKTLYNKMRRHGLLA